MYLRQLEKSNFLNEKPFFIVIREQTHQNTEKKKNKRDKQNFRNINGKHFGLGWLSYISFEITRDSYNLIGSNWCDLFKSHHML